MNMLSFEPYKEIELHDFWELHCQNMIVLSQERQRRGEEPIKCLSYASFEAVRELARSVSCNSSRIFEFFTMTLFVFGR